MSETISQSPTAAEPGPTVGTPAEAAVEAVASAASSDAAPAAEAAQEPAADTTTLDVDVSDRAPSLLSETKVEEAAKVEEPAKVEEAKAEEVKAEEPKAEEAKAEEPAEVKPPEPLPPPVYEKFAVPDGVKFDGEKLEAFTGILGEYENRIVTDPVQAHAAMQEMGQKMVDLYAAEVKDQVERSARLQRDVWDRTIESWRGEFREDPELGGNRAETSLSRMAGLLEMYGQSGGPDRLGKLRDVLTFTGAGDHPEVLRFVNWAASKLVETSKPVAAVGSRAPVQLTRSQRLYRNSAGAA